MNFWKGALPVVWVLLSVQALAQEQVVRYVNKYGKQVEQESAAFFQVIDIDTARNATVNQYTLDSVKVKSTSYKKYDPNLAANEAHGLYREWFKNGQLKEEGYFKNNKRDSTQTQWHENGQVWVIRRFKNNLLSDTLQGFYKSGALRRIEIYKDNGILVSGAVYTEDGYKIKPFFPFEEYPRYPGGESALFNFIGRKVKYPKIAIKSNVDGAVLLSFTIGKNGRVQDVAVVRSVHPALDEEALRVVLLMPKWIPGKQEGEPVAVKYHIPIKFTIK